MCGIAGIFSKDKDVSNKEYVNKMLSLLSHRGSSTPNVETIDNVHLGHTRLEIVGGNTGTQPVSIDDNVMVTFNGEIYNYLDLRTDLMRKGCRFRTKCDAEVIGYAYKIYGNVFVEKLKGIFAFVLYDKREGLLYLVRDRVGVKPLYYWNDTVSRIIFASEIKAFKFIHPLKFYEESLSEYLTFQYCLGRNTIFKDVYSVLPGEMLILKEPYSYKSVRYWYISENLVKRDFERYYRENYYEDRLLSIMHKVVRQQTPTSNVPFGVYVSGGIDSSSIAGLMAEYSDSFKLVSGKYDEPGYSESEYALKVAEHLNRESDFNVLSISEHDVTESIQKAIYHLDEPCAGPGLVGQLLLAKYVKEKFPEIRVMVGGQGGDELFGGYARYIVSYLEGCLLGAIYPKNREYVMNLDGIGPLMPVLQGYENMLKNFFSKDMFSGLDRRYYTLINRMNKTGLSKDFLPVYEKYETGIFENFYDIFNELGSVSYFSKMTYFDFVASLPALLQVDDRVNSAFEMESRVPFLDEEIIELAFSIPPTYKFSGGYSKGLLRKAMTGIIPDDVLWRRDKMGFPVPMQTWLNKKGEFYDLVYTYSNHPICKTIFGNTDSSLFNRDLWGKVSLGLCAENFEIGSI